MASGQSQQPASYQVAKKVPANGLGYYNVFEPDRDQAAGKNTAATTGLTLGIICLFANFFFLVSAGALIWSTIALTRANRWQREGYPSVGKARAIWGIVLGSVGAVGSLALKGGLF